MSQTTTHFIDAPIQLMPRLIYRLSYIVLALLTLYGVVAADDVPTLLYTIVYSFVSFALLRVVKVAHVAKRDALGFFIYLGFLTSILL